MITINRAKEIILRKEFFWRDKYNIFFLILAVLINLSSWIYLYIKIKPQTEPIYLHYNIYFGVDLIGQWYQIFFFPLTGLLVCLINTIISYIIYKREKIVSYIIIGITIFLQTIILAASWLVARQNI